MKFTSDWRLLKKFNSYLGPSETYQKLIPASQRYLSNLNPVNLFELKTPETQLGCFEEIMVRDGLLTLFSFFLAHPGPGSIKTRFLIHERFKAYVPQGWKDQVRFYSLYFRELPSPTKAPERTALIVKGLLHDSYLMQDPFHLKDQISHLISKKDKYQQIFFMPSSKTSLNHDSIFDQAAVLEKRLVEAWDELRRLNMKLEIVSSEDIKRSIDFRQAEFLDLHPTGFMYLDDYTDTFLLSRGCRPYFSQTTQVDPQDTRIDISPYHGVSISSHNTIESRFDEIRTHLANFDVKPGETEFFHLLKADFDQHYATLNKWNFYE